jgi:hypothetical protein
VFSKRSFCPFFAPGVGRQYEAIHEPSPI